MIAPFAFTPKATVSARTFPMAQALVKRGHRVTILVPPYDHLADAGQKLERCGVQIHNLTLKKVMALTPLSSAWRLAAAARRRHPDVVHVFKPVGYAALAGMILHQTSSLPLLVDSDDWEGRGGWNSVNPYPWHWKRFFDFQERWLPPRSAVVTVASRTLQTQMWGMGIPPERVIYVPNCPGPDLVARREQLDGSVREQVRRTLGFGSEPVAIYVGHMTLGDDLDLALHAFCRVRERIPEARLLMVGAGEGAERLRSLIAELDLERNVTLTGWIDHQQVPAYLAAADAAIYPYRDSLINRAKCSIKILEYMAMGKAIVTHRVGQNVEYLQHEQSGILVEPGNVSEFAAGLLAVLTDRALAERLGKAAAERVERQFSWTQRIVDVEQAYALAISTGVPQAH